MTQNSKRPLSGWEAAFVRRWDKVALALTGQRERAESYTPIAEDIEVAGLLNVDDPVMLGVWERMTARPLTGIEDAFSSYRYDIETDTLRQIEARICRTTLFIRSHPVPRWADINNTFPAVARFDDALRVDEIQSVELRPYSELIGNSGKARILGGPIMYARHPLLPRFHQTFGQDVGDAMISDESLSAIVVFTSDGLRLPVFLTYDNDLAFQMLAKIKRLIAGARAASPAPAASSSPALGEGFDL